MQEKNEADKTLNPTEPIYSELKIDNRLKKAIDEKKKLENLEEPTKTLLEENQETEPVITPMPKSLFFIATTISLSVIFWLFRKEITKFLKKGGSNA